MQKLSDVVAYCDAELRIGEIDDYDNALNGLQIENNGRVTNIGAAVDASVRTLSAASERGIDFLIVHHGVFWPGLRSIVAGTRELLRLAFERNIALYSAHIPLDVHPQFGNNALLIRALGATAAQPFFEWKNVLLGQRAEVDLPRDELMRRVRDLLGQEVKLVPAGPEHVRSLGVISGGAGGEILEVANHRIDTFLTGEVPHWAAVAAHDVGVNLIAGGHYATETFGVRAFAAHLAERYQLRHEFIDLPSGF